MKRALRFASSGIAALCVLLFVMPFTAHAREAFDIKRYHVDIDIDDMNVYRVREEITAVFHAPRHGLFRNIPYVLEMDWKDLDGDITRHKYRTFVKRVRVEGHRYSSYAENDNLIIKIGDADTLVSGTQQYNIEYTHELWDDQIPERDMAYYNIIPTGWDCDISDVSFSISLPKSFDSRDISFYYGGFGSVQNSVGNKLSYNVDSETNTINGVFNGTLAPGEGITLYLPLPQGYFVYPPPFPWDAALSAGWLIILGAVILLYVKFGRGAPLVTPVEFLPPEGLTPAEAGYIIDGAAEDRDVVSLILYWASKGNLSIERMSRTNFRLQKLADLPDSAKRFEKHMFGQLFKGREEVATDALKYVFYDTVEATKKMVGDYFSVRGDRALVTPASLSRGRLILFISFLPLVFTVGVSVYNRIFEWIPALIMSAVVTAFLGFSILPIRGILERWHTYRPARRTAALTGAIIFCAAVMAGYSVMLWQISGFKTTGVISALAVVLSVVLSVRIKKKTAFGADMLGRLIGFRNFIERAEKDRIQRLVEQTPSYFYDVLPYAYVLGVTDKWAKNFEGIALAAPSWYADSYSPGSLFTALYFNSVIMRSMSSMRQSMAARPAPKSGGVGGGGFGGGGGGFSGGGFGGGGGGSW